MSGTETLNPTASNSVLSTAAARAQRFYQGLQQTGTTLNGLGQLNNLEQNIGDAGRGLTNASNSLNRLSNTANTITNVVGGITCGPHASVTQTVTGQAAQQALNGAQGAIQTTTRDAGGALQLIQLQVPSLGQSVITNTLSGVAQAGFTSLIGDFSTITSDLIQENDLSALSTTKVVLGGEQ
jgi:hypothetical protein